MRANLLGLPARAKWTFFAGFARAKWTFFAGFARVNLPVFPILKASLDRDFLKTKFIQA